MKKVPIAQLKANLARYLDRMRAGESFIITNHGQAVATLEPLEWNLDSDETLRTLVLEGLVTPPTAELGDDFFTRPRAAKDLEGRVLKALIEERRGEEEGEGP